jgi:hypothetical protein
VDPVLVWIKENAALSGFLALLIAVAVPLLSWAAARFGSLSMREKLEGRASWDTLIAQFSGTARDADFGALDRMPGLAERVYGPRPSSSEAFGRCLSSAFAYPVLALLIGWVLFNAGDVGGMPFLPASDDWFDRVWRGVATILAGSLAGWVALNAERFSDFPVGILEKRVDAISPREPRST